jgi:hypothetical protein
MSLQRGRVEIPSNEEKRKKCERKREGKGKIRGKNKEGTGKIGGKIRNRKDKGNQGTGKIRGKIIKLKNKIYTKVTKLKSIKDLEM